MSIPKMESAKSEEVVEIDGSVHEGGGQMLRNSLALSTIFGKPLIYSNIRANRENPGINKQLETGISIIQEVCGAEAKGKIVKSKELTYTPHEIKSGSYFGDTHTAASLTLMLQSLVPILIFVKQDSTLKLKGGTTVGMSPPVKYTQLIIQGLLKRMGVDIDIQIAKEGFYPYGGGQADVKINPLGDNYIQPIEIVERGKIQKVYIEIITNWDEEETSNNYLKNMKKEIKKIIRLKQNEDEVDQIEFETIYNFSEELFKSGLKKKEETIQKQ